VNQVADQRRRRNPTPLEVAAQMDEFQLKKKKGRRCLRRFAECADFLTKCPRRHRDLLCEHQKLSERHSPVELNVRPELRGLFFALVLTGRRSRTRIVQKI
jgi:hypothetical protein